MYTGKNLPDTRAECSAPAAICKTFVPVSPGILERGPVGFSVQWHYMEQELRVELLLHNRPTFYRETDMNNISLTGSLCFLIFQIRANENSITIVAQHEDLSISCERGKEKLDKFE